MSGPSIRNWEFARALAKNHQVVLAAPNHPEISAEGFEIISHRSEDFDERLKESRVLIAQNLTIPLAFKAKKGGLKIIIDAYDPLPLEFLELFKGESFKKQKAKQSSAINQLTLNFKMADGIICASEKQRDLWTGFLLANQLIDPKRYEKDPGFSHFIDVVPFGLPTPLPVKDGPGIRQKFNLAQGDKIILWGGGIWNWFDPLTLINAIKIIGRNDIKLVFMGMKNPDPTVPEMEMARQAVALAKELNLLGKNVYFNDGWVPYNERHNYFLEASLGVSTHFAHLETRFSFRTRMLDYIWAGLPIVATKGDSFAELIEKEKIGITVPYEDPQALAHVITTLLDDPHKMELMKINLARLQPQFTWDKAIAPIEKMIKLIHQPSHRFQDLKAILSFTTQKVREKGLLPSLLKCLGV